MGAAAEVRLTVCVDALRSLAGPQVARRPILLIHVQHPISDRHSDRAGLPSAAAGVLGAAGPFAGNGVVSGGDFLQRPPAFRAVVGTLRRPRDCERGAGHRLSGRAGSLSPLSNGREQPEASTLGLRPKVTVR